MVRLCNFENMKYGPLYTNTKLYKIINNKNAFNVLIISLLLCQKVKTKQKISSATRLICG